MEIQTDKLEISPYGMGTVHGIPLYKEPKSSIGSRSEHEGPRTEATNH